jgi:acetyl-CoA acetyltransferase
MAALHAIAAIASGSAETVLTLRTVHRAGAAGGSSLVPGMERGAPGPFQFTMPYGSFTGSHWAGLYMQRHMAMYGTKEEDFGAFAVAQREYAIANPSESFFTEPLTIDDYLSARYIAAPLRLLDCDYPVDSSSALIFTTEERARDLRQKPVFFESWAMGTTQESDFSLVEDMTQSSPFRAARRVWSRTDLKPSDVGVAGLYDGFSFIALQWLEALGFCGIGEAKDFLDGGKAIARDGVIPLNTHGGQLSHGRTHGMGLIHEAVTQLRGDAGERQVDDARVAVVSSGGLTPSGAILMRTDA